MTNKTYVYDGQEVRKTGRTARKKSSRGRPRARGASSTFKEQIQIEIAALSNPNMDATPWKQWVREEELYQIDGESEPDIWTEE